MLIRTPQVIRPVRPVAHRLATPLSHLNPDPLANRKCLVLNGSGYASHADTDELNMTNADFAVGAWLKISTTNERGLVSKFTSAPMPYSLFVSSGNPRFSVNGGGTGYRAIGTSDVSDRTWHYLFGAYFPSLGSGNIKILVDGVEEASTNQTDALGDNSDELRVGRLLATDLIGQVALAELFRFGSGGAPSNYAEYAVWRYNNPYAPLTAFNRGCWSGYVEADRGEGLNETDFGTHVKWAVTNDFNDTGGNAHYTWSANQTSTLTQTVANRAKAGSNSHYYELTYTVAVTTALDGDFALTLTIGFAASSTVLPFTAGTHRVVFQSAAAAATGSFVIQAVSGTDTEGEFTIDDISLKETGNCLKCDLDGDYTDESSNALDLTEQGTGNRFERSSLIFYARK